MPQFQSAILALQVFHVAFLALHDWVPLGGLSDLKAVRAENSFRRLIITTLISTAPFAFGLAYTLVRSGQPYPGFLFYWLAISYALLFLGEMQAWWIPYLIWPQPKRAARYRVMFGNTWSFLPEHNGIVPNTLHCLLHSLTLLTLVLLGLYAAQA